MAVIFEYVFNTNFMVNAFLSKMDIACKFLLATCVINCFMLLPLLFIGIIGGWYDLLDPSLCRTHFRSA